MEHHANIVLAITAKKLKLKISSSTYARWEPDMDAFNSMVTHRVKMISITYASNVLGTINDVKPLSIKAMQWAQYSLMLPKLLHI